MALFRRNKTWWTDFSVNGQRFRQWLETTDWRLAQQEEKKLITGAETGKLTRPGRAPGYDTNHATKAQTDLTADPRRPRCRPSTFAPKQLAANATDPLRRRQGFPGFRLS